MRTRIFITVLCLLSLNAGAQNKTDVLNLATIHGRHAYYDYTYQDIIDVLSSYKPDLICVEIRKEDFREDVYLSEMMLATAYGDMKEIPVAPIDFWHGDANKNARTERDSLIKLEKYRKLLEVYDSIYENNSLVLKVRTEYGNIYKNESLDLYFWNGSDYNNMIREKYDLSMKLFGDSPVNLYFYSRNSRMLENIKEAVKLHNAKKVIVLAGAEHKYFFDDALSQDDHFSVVDINELQIENHVKLEDVAKKQTAQLYFRECDSVKTEDFYKSLLSKVMHGPGMDIDPALIDTESLPRAKAALNNWQKEAPESVSLKYEWAWYWFIKSDYEKSLAYCKQFIKHEKSRDFKVFNRNAALRLSGFCYDMLGEREKAVECYKTAKEGMVAMNEPEWKIQALLKDYLENPFSLN